MAAITDKITDTRNAARPNPTTVSSGRSAGGTTLSCANLTGWPTASKVHGVTYQIDSNSNPVAGTQLDFSAIRSSNDLTSFTVVDGTDTGNSIGDVVEMLPTAAWGQDLADALTSQHSRLGAHVGITNTEGMTTDDLTVSDDLTVTDDVAVGGDLAVTGTSTLTGAIGGAGYSMATMSNPYKFFVYRGAAANTGNGAFAKVTFDTEDYDTNSNFATGTYTAPVAGFYHFSAHFQAAVTSDAQEIIISLFKNGSAFIQGGQIRSSGATQNLTTTLTADVQLAANDTVEVHAFGAAAFPITATRVGNHFNGHLISKT